MTIATRETPDLVAPDELAELAELIRVELRRLTGRELGLTLQIFEAGVFPRSQMISTADRDGALEMLRLKLEGR